MKKVIVYTTGVVMLLLSLLFTGCASVSRVVAVGASTNDQALEAAEFTICNAASVGSVKRRYGNTEELVKVWSALCNGEASGSKFDLGVKGIGVRNASK